MKNLLTSMVSFFVFISFGFAQNCNDFRNFCWGTSFTKVKTTEKSRFVHQNSNDTLEYHSQLGGSDCDIIYTFNDNDKLISGSYLFTKTYSSPQLFLQDYNKFKTLLVEKYGKATSEIEGWSDKNISKEVNHENYGQLIAEGKLNLTTNWETEKLSIKIVLITLNNRPSLQIHYTAKNLNDLENKLELQKVISKL